jgi:HEAT repeat protein
VRQLLGLLALLVFAAVSAANVDELIKKLASRDSDVRRGAARDLADLGKDAKPAAKALTAALKDSDRYVRRRSAEALGNIGPDAKDAIGELSKLTGDGDQATRQAAVKALGKMGEAGVPALTKALSGTASDVQENAITALGEVGAAGVPALIGAIRNAKMDSSLRRKALQAVLAQGSEARAALPALVATVKSRRGVGRDFRLLRIEAINALGRLANKEDAMAVGALDNLVKDAKLRDNGLKNAAKKALAMVQNRDAK